jgi:hypothetical protein
MWKQRACGDASHTQTGRPEQTGAKGETALDENNDLTETQEYPTLQDVPYGHPLEQAKVEETRKLESRMMR